MQNWVSRDVENDIKAERASGKNAALSRPACPESLIGTCGYLGTRLNLMQELREIKNLGIRPHILLSTMAKLWKG